jgi:hypothetical protein
MELADGCVDRSTAGTRLLSMVAYASIFARL